MANLSALAVFKKAGSAAVVRPLGALASMLTNLQGQLYQAPDELIPGIKATDWPSPLQPVRPFGPPDAQPLGFNMQMGQNLIFTPRPDSRYTAADLQALARYPLARMCISNVENIISSLGWKIQLRAQPGEDKKAREAKQLKDDTILKLTDFMTCPDGEHEFQDWVQPLIDDMLRIDAGCVLLRKAKDGTVYELRVMQAAYITRLVDANGYTPAPPAPAFQQLWEGIPRVNLSSDQLIYRPRKIVYEEGNIASALYGCSPTEEMAEEIEIGIQRLRYVKAFYKDGSIPNVLWVVPSDTQPDIVKAAMNFLNSDMRGNLESRRMFRFAQGFKTSDSPKEELIKQLEEPKLSDEFDDLHIKKICFGYGISAQRLTRPMNRASAQSNQEAAEEEGISPFREWVERTINFILQGKMGYKKYEFKFDISQDPDPSKQSEIDKIDLESGVATVNEKRIARGWDPRSEPEADQLGKWITTGWVPMGLLPTPPEPKPDTAANGRNDDDEPDGDGNKPPAGGKGKQKLAKANAQPAVLDPNRDTIRCRTAKAQLFAKVYKFFHEVRSNMVIVSPRAKKVAKAENEPLSQEEIARQVDQMVDEIMASIPWDTLPESVEAPISEASLDGASIGIDQAGRAVQAGPLTVSLAPTPVRVITSSVISDVNQVAMDYARNRGAELVGMKWVNGVLVQNPRAAMAITDSTRDMLRQILTEAFEQETPMNELAARIQATGVFSEERARFIAETEVKFAQSRGNLEAWKKTGVVKSIEWLVSMLHEDDEEEECTENEDEGPIPLGELFPSGDPAPPAHPRCRCSAHIVELNDENKKAA